MEIHLWEYGVFQFHILSTPLDGGKGKQHIPQKENLKITSWKRTQEPSMFDHWNCLAFRIPFFRSEGNAVYFIDVFFHRPNDERAKSETLEFHIGFTSKHLEARMMRIASVGAKKYKICSTWFLRLTASVAESHQWKHEKLFKMGAMQKSPKFMETSLYNVSKNAYDTLADLGVKMNHHESSLEMQLWNERTWYDNLVTKQRREISTVHHHVFVWDIRI